MQNKLAAKHIRLDVCTLIKTDTDAPMFDKHGCVNTVEKVVKTDATVHIQPFRDDPLKKNYMFCYWMVRPRWYIHNRVFLELSHTELSPRRRS